MACGTVVVQTKTKAAQFTSYSNEIKPRIDEVGHLWDGLEFFFFSLFFGTIVPLSLFRVGIDYSFILYFNKYNNKVEV